VGSTYPPYKGYKSEGERSKAANPQFRFGAAKKPSSKVEKEARMFEPKASCRASHFATRLFGNPKGSDFAVAFFCLLFLARQEK
jgi:hypothetical protein